MQKYGQLDPDSDYDGQESDFVPIDTDVMPLGDQDPKLRADYIDLPHLTFAELYDPNGMVPLLLPYSAVWEAMLVKGDWASHRSAI